MNDAMWSSTRRSTASSTAIRRFSARRSKTSGSVIGRGGQRTTTENIEYGWGDVVVIDTPGVGAYQGSVDEVVADIAVRDADAALWVTSTDGVQLATAEPIRRFLDSGIPVVVLVNHRQTLSAEDVASLPDGLLIRLFGLVRGHGVACLSRRVRVPLAARSMRSL